MSDFYARFRSEVAVTPTLPAPPVAELAEIARRRQRRRRTRAAIAAIGMFCLCGAVAVSVTRRAEPVITIDTAASQAADPLTASTTTAPPAAAPEVRGVLLSFPENPIGNAPEVHPTWLPPGFRLRGGPVRPADEGAVPGTRFSSSQTYVDASQLPHAIVISGSRQPVDPELYAAIQAGDIDRARALRLAAPDWQSEVFKVDGRLVISLTSSVAAPASGLADRRDEQLQLVTGPDTIVQVNGANMTRDELVSVLKSLVPGEPVRPS